MSRPHGPPLPVAVVLAEQTWGSVLHAVRSLAGCGAQVHVVVAGRGASVYRATRACASAVDVDAADAGDPVAFGAALRARVATVVPAGRTVVVVPTSDRLLALLHRCRDDLDERYRLVAPPAAVCDDLLDKRSAFVAATGADLRVPPWEAVGTAAELEGLQLEGPVVARPARSMDPGASQLKVVAAPDPASLGERVHRALDAGVPLVVQRDVAGPGATVDLALVWRSADGARTEVRTGRKRRQSAPEGGVMVWGEALPLPDVESATRRFVESSGFTGLGGIEFIRNGADLDFIEFNPRLEAIHFLATAAGLDTVAMAYRDMAGLAVPPAGPPVPAAAWMGGPWLERLRHDPPYRRTALADRLAFAQSPRRARAVWSWSDPLPGVVLSARVLRSASGVGGR